jgi:hypothetical protein
VLEGVANTVQLGGDEGVDDAWFPMKKASVCDEGPSVRLEPQTS